MQDLIVSPPNVSYAFSLSPDSAVVDVGDTVAPFTGTFAADGRAVGFTPGFTVVAGANVVRVDSLGRLIVLGRGVARIRVQPLSIALPVDGIADTVTAWAVVPRIGLSTARTEDTLTSLQETLTIQATAQTRSGVAIPNVPLAWRQVSGGAVAVLEDTAAGRVRAVANGLAEFEATVDTVHVRRTVRVVQRPTALINSVDTVRLRALGQARSVSATLRDARANLMANLTPVWLSKNTSIATVATGGQVQAVGEGTTQVIASYSDGGVSLADTTTVIVQQARLNQLSGNAQTGAVRAALAAPFVAQLVDGAGTALRDSGVAVIFGVASGGGHFGVATDTLRTADTLRTDIQGQAHTTGTLGKLVGANAFSANGIGLAGPALMFAATGTSASARTLAADSGLAQTDTVGLTLASAFVVIAHDAFGNAVGDLRVAFVVTAGGGKFGGLDSLVTATDPQGRARATLTLGAVAGANVVEARAAVPVGSPVIFAATALPGPTLDYIVVSPATPTLTALGATQTFAAQAFDSLNRPLVAQPTFTWSSATPGTATINAGTGVAIAVANGTTVITAAAGGKSGTATLTVTQALDHIVVSPATPTLTALGATQAFTAVAFDVLNVALASQPTFTWNSGTPGTATIDATTGVATAVANGTTVITATAGGRSGTAALTVTQALDHIVVSPATPTLTALGATQAFTAQAQDALNQPLVVQPTFTWISGTPATATINAGTGVATAVAFGTTVITATAGAKSGMATLTVTQAADHIVVSPATPTLTALGATQSFTAQAQDALNQPLAVQPTFAWSSATPGTATINEGTGVATAVANGTTMITAAAGGKSGTATLTVSQVAKTFTLTPAGTSLEGVGSSVTLTVTTQDSLGNPMVNPTLTWTTLNPAIASVAGGIVTAVAAGQTTVQVTAGSVIGYALVTVTAPAATPVNLWSTVSSPTGNALTGVWAANPNDAWAVGAGGVAVHFNGTTWTGVLAGTTSDLNSVWGAGPNAVYAVGTSGRVLRYNGSVWDTLPRFTTSTSLGAIWGASPADLFVAAGTQVYHYDGTAWRSQANLPNVVNALWGTSRSDVWAVGSGGQIHRYDGSSWTQVYSPTSYSIATVWGTSATNVYIGGDYGKAFRWDGSNWYDITPPQALTSWPWGYWAWQYVGEFWGPTPTDIYATLVHPSAVPETWTAHYDGSAWTVVRHDSTVLHSLRGTSDGSVHVVGGSGRIVRGYRAATVTVAPATPILTALGETQQLTATASSGSTPITGVTGWFWSSATPAVATVNATTGLATAVANGTATITATAPGGAAGSATVTVGQALDHIVVSPATPTLTALGATQAFTAQAQDALNQPLVVQPTFAWSSATLGTATIDATTGVATAVANGTTVIAAAAAGLSGTATLTVAAYKLVFVTQPSAIVRNAPFNPTVQVALRDASGNSIPGASATINIAVGSNPGGGSLAGPVSVSTASGVATFAALSVTAAGSGYTLVATASGYVSDTSQMFDVAAHGPATALAFVTQPTSTGYLVDISPSVRVAVQDQYGNAVSSSLASLALALSTNPSGATLLGGGTIDAVAGIATFANVNLDRAGTGYKLTASVTSGPSVPNIASNSFNVTQTGTVVSSTTAINGMVRDGSTIYFTQRGSATGTVGMVATNGGPVTTLATDLLQPVAITTDGANVYWIETGDGGTAQARIGRRAISGGTVETVAAGLTIANGGYWLKYEAGYLYWIQGAWVQKVSASATNGVPTTLATDTLAIRDMTVNAGTVYYFTANPSSFTKGSIRSVPAVGGETSLVAANVTASYGAGAMMVIGGDLYFGGYTDAPGLLYPCVASVPITGGTATCRNSRSGVQGLWNYATDGASLYMVARVFTIESVWRFPLSDFASPTELVSNHQWYIGDQSRLLDLDAQSVYYNANYQSSGQAIPIGLLKQSK